MRNAVEVVLVPLKSQRDLDGLDNSNIVRHQTLLYINRLAREAGVLPSQRSHTSSNSHTTLFLRPLGRR